ncbi:hypothetical protein [Hymenobacter psychrophilus]|nr:hypothetical protein [Hymenobacter psychrophilus]
MKSEVSRLKAENSFLRKKLAVATAGSTLAPGRATPAVSTGVSLATIGKETVERVEFSLVKCEGNRKAQTVTVELLLRNMAPTRDLQFASAKGIDASGEEYKTYDIHIGSGNDRNALPTNVPVKTRITIPKVLPTTQSLVLFACPVYSDSQPGREVMVQFENVPIAWK